MGKGIAKDFKAYFPEMFKYYQAVCERGEFQIGSLLYWRGPHKSVLNFPTKRHWRQRSRIEDIESGLRTFIANYERLSIMSVAFPQLGCGNGELDWESQVRPLMERYLGSLPIDVYVHLDDGRRQFVEHRNVREMKTWLRNEPVSLPFTEVWDDLKKIVVAMDDGEDSYGRRLSVFAGPEDDESICFRDDEGSVIIARDDMRYLWLRLKSFGLFTASDLADEHARIGKSLVELFAKLAFVMPVRLAPTEPAFDPARRDKQVRWVDGVKLVPLTQQMSQSDQKPLALFG